MERLVECRRRLNPLEIPCSYSTSHARILPPTQPNCTSEARLDRVSSDNSGHSRVEGGEVEVVLSGEQHRRNRALVAMTWAGMRWDDMEWMNNAATLMRLVKRRCCGEVEKNNRREKD